jgi:endonuclease YncB( thermonuclease family)
MRALLVFAFCFAAAQPALAELRGKVVKVQDGDTLTLLIHRAKVRIRLADIDAPELKQPFGKRSWQSLADMCAGKSARVAVRGKDGYGVTLGQVDCSGTDANAEQIRRGMAWVFVRYAHPDSALYRFEYEARRKQVGLWGEPGAVAPWDWRLAQDVKTQPARSAAR